MTPTPTPLKSFLVFMISVLKISGRQGSCAHVNGEQVSINGRNGSTACSQPFSTIDLLPNLMLFISQRSFKHIDAFKRPNGPTR
jgi:hypothetical protein